MATDAELIAKYRQYNPAFNRYTDEEITQIGLPGFEQPDALVEDFSRLQNIIGSGVDRMQQGLGFVRDKLIELKLLDPIDSDDKKKDKDEDKKTVTPLRDLVGSYKIQQKILKDEYEAKKKNIINNQKRATTRANMLKTAEKQYNIDKNIFTL